METITNSIDERKIAKITAEAHKALPKLKRLMSERSEFGTVTQIEAASRAILYMTARLERSAQRRQQKQVTG